MVEITASSLMQRNHIPYQIVPGLYLLYLASWVVHHGDSDRSYHVRHDD